MAAAIPRFLSRADLLRRDQRARVGQLLSEFEAACEAAELAHAERRVLASVIAEGRRVVDRRTAAESLESFIMLMPSQNFYVVDRLSKESKRPHVAVRLWALLFQFVRAEDGEILITREGLIERVGASSRSVDDVLKELVDLKALIRLREPEPGKQGRGTVRYFMNPRVGTHLPQGERELAQAAAPRLGGNVVSLDGSVLPSERRSYAPSFPPVVL